MPNKSGFVWSDTADKWVPIPKAKSRKPKMLYMYGILGNGNYMIPEFLTLAQARRIHEWLGRFIAWKEGQKNAK